MKIGELAFKIHVHRVHAWRLARAGIIPGTKKTKGGHFYFVESKSLNRWINFMRAGGAHRKKEMKRAYQRGYGNETPSEKKTEKEHLYWFRYYRNLAKENRKEFKSYLNDYEDLFQSFFDDTDNLIRILKELTIWRECNLKAAMSKTSCERLIILRDLINAWLNQQQSGRT